MSFPPALCLSVSVPAGFKHLNYLHFSEVLHIPVCYKKTNSFALSPLLFFQVAPHLSSQGLSGTRFRPTATQKIW
jgi:hypothetical protein